MSLSSGLFNLLAFVLMMANSSSSTENFDAVLSESLVSSYDGDVSCKGGRYDKAVTGGPCGLEGVLSL